jgi:hypothetical protein
MLCYRRAVMTCLACALGWIGFVCPAAAQSESFLVIQEPHYDPANPQPSPADHNTVSVYARGRGRYVGSLSDLDEASQLVVACFMNTEAASAEKPGKDWRDTSVSCWNNNVIQSPDYPHLCGEHQPALPLLDTFRELGTLQGLFLDCLGGGGFISRCFNSSQPNQYVGWVSAGTTLSGQRGVAVKFDLPFGETACHRYFDLGGSVEGLERGDEVRLVVSLPSVSTGTVEDWKVVLDTSRGVGFGGRQIGDGASYTAQLTAQPEKKNCSFKRNGEQAIQATFVGVDDQGRLPSGKDLTDLSVSCVCENGEGSCPPDAALLAETAGLEKGEVAHVKVTIQLTTGTPRADTYAINRNGVMRVIDNLPSGSTYLVEFEQVIGRAGMMCTVQNDSGTIEADDETFSLDCSCEFGGTGDCEEPPPEGFREILPEVEVFEICQFVPEMCPTLDPWWWGVGPESGPEPCQRETVCVDGPIACWTDPGTGETFCGTTLICKDQCMPQSQVVLQGPFIGIDGQLDRPLSGRVLLSGFASDEDGVRMLRFYLDGQQLALENFRDDVPRPDACRPIRGDCTPVGFQGELDTTAWPDGVHRLVVFAVDDRAGYPVPTFLEMDIEVSNSCSATSSPTASLQQPTDGAVVAGTVHVEAQAAAENGVERVRFYLDGTRVATDWAPPYRWSWVTTEATDGLYKVHAEVLDNCGNAATTSARSVVVANRNDPPEVALEAPTPLLELSGFTTVSGWALDADGVGSVSLRLGGQTLPLASPVEWVDRPDVCSATSVADPRCPRVGWRTSFDTTLWPDGEYSFKVVVLDGRGAAGTHQTTLAIRNAPLAPPIVSTPASKSIVAGDDVTFKVMASGAGPMDFQWQFRSGATWLALSDGARSGRVSGAATSILSIADVETADQAAYRCMVTSPWGTTASSAASLSVHEVTAPPTVTAGLDQQVTEGAAAALSVLVQGIEPLAFRWQKWTGSWVDLADDLHVSGAATPLLEIASTQPGDAGSYRCRVSNPGGTTHSGVVALTIDPLPVGTCQPSESTLCFQANRFAVTATVNGSPAQTMPFSQEGAFFWMFEPQTVEVVVKILDGTSANGYFWVFHGSLTNLAYSITVTDTITGVSKSYLKTAGHFCGEADTAAFGASTSAPATAGLLVPLAPGRAVASSSTPCSSSATATCLLDGKFKVEVLKSGAPQPGVAVTNLSASFGFVTALAPETVVKVIDGTSVNGWYWLFFGSLTHQDFTVRVTDSANGEFRTYPSPGQFCGGVDTTAF